MRVIFTPRARADLRRHLAYGKERFGARVAEKTLERLESFIATLLAPYPRTARYDAEIDAYESWVPRTPFVVFFRVECASRILRILAIRHHAQDRAAFDPDAED